MNSYSPLFSIGIIWSLGFILPEAIQAVFFGAVFQRMDSFFVGGTVFALATASALVWIFLREPSQFAVARSNLGDLVGANITNAAAWVLYFLAVQRIEPVIAFTIFSGMIRMTTMCFKSDKSQRAQSGSCRFEIIGNALLILGMLWLSVVTIGGWSGFTRGETTAALFGIGLSVASGAIFAGMLFYCSKLDRVCLSPISQIGLRFPLYLLVCLIGVILGFDEKPTIPISDTILVICIAIPLMSFPIFCLQKAITTASSLTVGAVSATVITHPPCQIGLVLNLCVYESR